MYVRNQRGLAAGAARTGTGGRPARDGELARAVRRRTAEWAIGLAGSVGRRTHHSLLRYAKDTFHG